MYSLLSPLPSPFLPVEGSPHHLSATRWRNGGLEHGAFGAHAPGLVNHHWLAGLGLTLYFHKRIQTATATRPETTQT